VLVEMRICIRTSLIPILIYLTVFVFENEAIGMNTLKSARELLEIAGDASSKVLSDETAESLPLATKSGSTVRIVILYYKESMRPGEEIMYPPHHIMIIDAESGKIVSFKPCSPSELGVNKSLDVPEKGFGLEPQMNSTEFWRKTDHFLELSQIVWITFALGTIPDSQTVAIIREYYSLFKQIAKKPLLPYYKAIAPDFLNWLSQISK